MSTVLPIKQKTKLFQIRWNEPLGKEGSPYAYRYVFIFFGYSIRIHKWLCSDGKVEKSGPHYHNHPWWFCTFVLKGGYNDFYYKEDDEFKTGFDELTKYSFRFRKANHLHYVVPFKIGCTTLLITGRPNSKWGFWVNNRILRPLKYFKRFGDNAPCKL
ncbi:MAG: hypothetical protein ABIP51_18155 [Bacteroidia bacterium]